MVIPASTYRLQITAEFDLTAASELCGYLAQLGVGAVYCSPLLSAAKGSGHGYDVVDHSEVDAERGGRSGWVALLAAARNEALGVVVDIVPNHAGVGDPAQNPAWWDVLRHGRASPYASWFDIEWDSGRIQIPVLGDDFEPTQLRVDDQELCYSGLRFPLAPRTAGGTAAQVHDRQVYELVNFRQADTDLNYRRFFAVTTLAGLRVEDEEVFEATHREVLRWVNQDGIDGLRIDHPDGLADPGSYLDRLHQAASGTWVTVEKILQRGEELPRVWPVAGTTGYDALAEVSNVFVDPSSEQAMTDLYQEVTGDRRTFAEHVDAGKRLQVSTVFQAEVTRLTRLVPSVPSAADALVELLVAFPVYRSYLPLGLEHLQHAAATAQRRRPELAVAIANLFPRLSDASDELARRFQQLSGAVMAKGVEDTAYYRYTRFIALNEVGGDPSCFGASIADFHRAQQHRHEHWPASMTTLSTHDTKRGEDVRARLFCLAELPDEWGDVVRPLIESAQLPSSSMGYLLWQTLAGTGFISRERLHAYAEKAMREAANETNWIDPNEEFELAAHAALDAVYEDPALRAPIERFLDRIAPFARSNTLSQKLIALTIPGVPDVYQGTEIYDDSLVDPDNRRPVDFALRRRLLSGLAAPHEPAPQESPHEEKLAVVSAALHARRDHPNRFTTYRVVEVTGPRSEHAVAFDRGGAITAVTRLPASLAAAGGWDDTKLEVSGTWRDVLTGRSHVGPIPAAELFADLPVALLLS
jgi:(1->4)-alpha-D-glucan 1-alpha-D-glucosylmutase